MISTVEKSTLFLRTIFDIILLVEICTLFPCTFFDVISPVVNSALFPLTFFDVILMVKRSTLFAGNSWAKTQRRFWLCCKLMKRSRRLSFVSSFKKLIFARLFSLNVSSKSPWCSPVSLKFDSYNLQHCKMNCRKFVFWVLTEQLIT